MALNIKDPDTDMFARRLANLTGRSITDAVKLAIKEALDKEERRQGKASWEEIQAFLKRAQSRPIVDPRTADEILGYDERGLPR